MIKRFNMIFFFFLNLTIAHAADVTPLIKTYYFVATENKSLEEHLVRYRLNDSQLRDIQKWNPQVNNFHRIAVGTRLYIEVPYENYLLSKTRFEGHSQRKETAAVREVNASPPPLVTRPAKPIVKRLPSAVRKTSQVVSRASVQKRASAQEQYRSRLSLFYAYSMGDFVHSIQGKSVKTSQNSPLTLGLSYYQKIENNYNVSASTYYSHLQAVQVSGLEASDDSLRNPYEYGLTAYLERANLFSIKGPTPYAGVDYESFDAYNLDEVNSSSDPLDFRRQNILYGTVGVAHSFNFLQQSILLKLSASQSVQSSSESSKSYAGRKFMFFITTPVQKDWSVNLFVKRHDLSGVTDLVITRVGMGLGYHF
jgi:hypothetical protein